MKLATEFPSKEEIARGYDQLGTHLSMPRKYHRRCARLMRRHLRPGMAVADLGCGHGGLLRELRLLDSTLKLSAIDLSPVRVNNARERVPDAEVRVGDIEALPFANAEFEAAFATEFMEHLPDPVKALREIWRVLKPGSWLLVSLPNRDWFHFADYQASRLRVQPMARRV